MTNLKKIAIMLSLLFLMVPGCTPKPDEFSVGEEIILERTIVAAIGMDILQDIENTISEGNYEKTCDTLDEYMVLGSYFAIPHGTKIKVLEKEGGYAKFLIIDGYLRVGEELWTFESYLYRISSE
ncbi:MAG: hypothetical protein FWG40_01725 [Peptococcaceae bacterium]|nr:hypothetical protein [Peptococcaceae bacterium]